jgi:hypothetical protein
MHRVASVFLLALLACGKASPTMTVTAVGPGSQTLTEICSGAPTPNLDGSYTAADCRFVQQTDNMVKFGASLAAGLVRDNNGVAVGTFTHSCDRWMLGKDASGLSIVLDTQSGDVVSHGSLHGGFPTSAVPTPVALPISGP